MKMTLLSAVLLCLACEGCAVEQERSAGAPPKVILLIGDGMDDHQITIARDYLVGYDGRLTLDDMPTRSAVQVQTVAEEDPRVPEYVPDSANTATSMASGIVTSAGRIATTAATDRDVVTIMELPRQLWHRHVDVEHHGRDAGVLHARQSALCEGPCSMVFVNSAIRHFRQLLGRPEGEWR
jgi:hypothetical protein